MTHLWQTLHSFHFSMHRRKHDLRVVFVFQQTNCCSYAYLRMFSLLKNHSRMKKKNGNRLKTERQSPDITAIHPAESRELLGPPPARGGKAFQESLLFSLLSVFFPQINLSGSRINLGAHCGEMFYLDRLCTTRKGSKTSANTH